MIDILNTINQTIQAILNAISRIHAVAVVVVWLNKYLRIVIPQVFSSSRGQRPWPLFSSSESLDHLRALRVTKTKKTEFK